MRTESEQKVQADGIFFENPLRKKDPKATKTIAVSSKRFELILSRIVPAVMISSKTSIQEKEKLFRIGPNLVNALMPDQMDHVLKEVLTLRQYQRALRANHEGKILEFRRIGR